MVRMKPQEVVIQTYGAHFDQMCLAADSFWQLNTLPATDGPIIYADLLAQDIRVGIRVLTLASAIRRHTPARIVAVVGPDPYWRDMIWSYYDVERLKQLARAHGVDDIIDLNQVVERSIGGESTFVVAGREITIPERTAVDPQRYADIAEATHLRALRIPVVTPEVAASDEYARLEARNQHYARVYDALMGADCAAYVTSHVDYHQWGFGVDAAMRSDVPVFHLQSTGSLKCYALFPETADRSMTARMNWTLQIADHFERYVWPARDALRRSAEIIAFRAKMNHGRPAWWRGGGTISELGFRSETERASVREHAMRKLGFDPAKPVVAVYSHAISDAVNSNLEIFDDLAAWFTGTARFAVERDDANWLFLDHPAQENYDGTMMFEGIAEEHAAHPHLVFRRSMELTKNVLWSLVDLAVTVRGSISNEFPAYGVPALQAGWSEWSHVGFSMRADSQAEYWELLGGSIARLRAGERLITDEQIERARLWLWHYRSESDVPSAFVPHWESSQGEQLYRAIRLALMQVEADGDAGLVAVRRMLTRRDPFLLRADLHRPMAEIADTLGIVGEVDMTTGRSAAPAAGHPSYGFGMSTIFDEQVESTAVPAEFRSGADPAFVVFDGVSRGVAVFGRCSWHEGLIGLKLEPFDEDVVVTFAITLDKVSHQWWARDHADRPAEESRRPRHVVVRAHGEVVGGFTVAGEEGKITHSCVIPGGGVPDGGLLMLELVAFDGHEFEDRVNTDPLLGLQIDSISIRPAEGPLAGQTYVADGEPEGERIAQGCVVAGEEAVRLRFRIAEEPEPPAIPPAPPLGLVERASRKLGLVRRRDEPREEEPPAEEAVELPSIVCYRPDGEPAEVPLELVDGYFAEATFEPGPGVRFFELTRTPG